MQYSERPYKRSTAVADIVHQQNENKADEQIEAANRERKRTGRSSEQRTAANRGQQRTEKKWTDKKQRTEDREAVEQIKPRRTEAEHDETS